MPKLYFKFGVMGSSKSAQALMTKYNYEQKGFKVLLAKPKLDNRSDENNKTIISSRIGLKSEAYAFEINENIYDTYNNLSKKIKYDAIIIDEAQFCTKQQVEQLKQCSLFVPVLCFGLKTNFKTELFEGSKRLIEIADSIAEIKSICRCGNKATINAKFVNGKLCTTGDEIDIGGDEKYESMCYNCYMKMCKS